MERTESYLCAMFYKWLFFFFLLPACLWAQINQSAQLYQENRLWGLKLNNPITPAVYDTIIPITNTNLFIAKKHGKGFNSTGIISNKGKNIIPFNYRKITPTNNYYIVHKWEHNIVVQGVVSPTNKIVLNLRFNEIKSFNNFWIARTFSGGLQLFNTDGSLIKTINADSVSVTENSQYLLLHKAGKVGILNANGIELFPPKFKQIINKNGNWEAIPYAKWQVISKRDTIVVFADTLKVWGNNYSIVGLNNNFLISARNKQIGKSYESIHAVTSNLAITKRGTLHGVVTKLGEEVLTPSFGNMYFAKGYFYTKNNNKWSVYDSLGKKRSVFKYDSIGSIANGLFPIKRKGKWGFMNRDGKEVIHCIYDSEANFRKGKAIIQYFGATGIIDTNGNWIVKPQIGKILDYSYNFYITKKEDLYYLKNYTNELIYFTSNTLIFKNETIFEIRDGYTNKVSSLGRLINNTPQPEEGSKHWQIIKIGGKYGFENTQGLLKITYRYDSLFLFTEGLAAFKLREKWGFINEHEEIIVQPLFNKVTPFKNNLAIVTQHGKKGLLRSNGSFLLKPKFDNIMPIDKNLWLVKENELYGIYNINGKIIIQAKFDEIKYVYKSLIIVIRNDKYGGMDNQGVSVLPRIYDYIGYDNRYKLLILKQFI